MTEPLSRSDALRLLRRFVNDEVVTTDARRADFNAALDSLARAAVPDGVYVTEEILARALYPIYDMATGPFRAAAMEDAAFILSRVRATAPGLTPAGSGVVATMLAATWRTWPGGAARVSKQSMPGEQPETWNADSDGGWLVLYIGRDRLAPTPHPEDAPEPETMEREAGRLLVEAARLRAARAGRGDAHELRHLWAAINAGNSDPCGENGESCHLDVEAIRRWTEQYPKVAGLAPQPTDTPEAGS